MPDFTSLFRRPPDDNPTLAPLLIAKWHANYINGPHFTRPKAIPELPFRLSSVGRRCDRALVYDMAGAGRTEPETPAGLFRMRLGQLVHDEVAVAVAEVFGERAVSEKVVDLKSLGIAGSGHVDHALVDGDAVVELKSMNGTGYRSCVTGSELGPREDHLLQGLLAAAALDVANVKVLYISLEALAANKVRGNEERRIMAEWTYTVDELRPMLDHEVARIRRLQMLRSAGDDLFLPARTLTSSTVSTGAVIDDPKRGAWLDIGSNGRVRQAGTVWFCGYCPWRGRCIADGPEAHMVSVEAIQQPLEDPQQPEGE